MHQSPSNHVRGLGRFWMDPTNNLTPPKAYTLMCSPSQWHLVTCSPMWPILEHIRPSTGSPCMVYVPTIYGTIPIPKTTHHPMQPLPFTSHTSSPLLPPLHGSTLNAGTDFQEGHTCSWSLACFFCSRHVLDPRTHGYLLLLHLPWWHNLVC